LVQAGEEELCSDIHKLSFSSDSREKQLAQQFRQYIININIHEKSCLLGYNFVWSVERARQARTQHETGSSVG
jgi:hypothetical protein